MPLPSSSSTSFFSPRSPVFLRLILLGLVTSIHLQWSRLINNLVPNPYLDEVFHIPQAQAYWSGKWSRWDPKITTPPGLYLFSHTVNTVRTRLSSSFQEQTTESLRLVNVLLFYGLILLLYAWKAVSRRSKPRDTIRDDKFAKLAVPQELSMACFPLFFFFSGLYYTDLFSTFTVLATYTIWLASVQRRRISRGSKLGLQLLHVVVGAVSLATRQTNIFWVAVFLGGLQVVESIKARLGVKSVHDQPVSEAYFEDFPITTISIAQHGLGILPQLILDLWPQLTLLVGFAVFVVWNGGVVLGDKDNHIATIHLPQMLYIWPFMVFMSWPVLLPTIYSISLQKSPGANKSHIPRLATIATFTIVFAAIVHFNTIVHPFTLADNRHYVFYVFRILRRHYLIKYAVVPIYVLCAWIVITALGGGAKFMPASRDVASEGEVVRVSFVLVWLISTTVSLVTAPLVEPRYFIIPWLMWRLHVPEIANSNLSFAANSSAERNQHSSNPLLSWMAWLARNVVAFSSLIELVWYMVINAVTGYMFLYRGFAWPQEPGRVQRFMW